MEQPKMRFKREDGTSYPDWRKDKWLDLGQFVSSGTLSKADLSEEGTPCILYGELYTKYREIAHTIYSKTNSSSHIFSKKDDVILPKSGETPEDISTATCIPYDDVSLGGDLIVFRHNEKVIGAFLSYLISNRAKNAIASIAQGKSVVHISKKGLANIELSFPCLEEQQKIADFLSTIDEVIAQSEVEVQNLEQQKKAAMRKIFSQEVKFKREDGTEFPDWEESTLGKECVFINGKAHENCEAENGRYIIVNSKFISTSGEVKRKTNIILERLYIGDIVMVMSDVPNGKAMSKCFVIKENDKYTLNQRICALRTKHNSMYISHQISRCKYFMLFDDGVKQTNLKKQDVLDCPISIPCFEEQQKIADFLSAYDEAISYAKQEFNKWKELKKGLLQQMFV